MILPAALVAGFFLGQISNGGTQTYTISSENYELVNPSDQLAIEEGIAVTEINQDEIGQLVDFKISFESIQCGFSSTQQGVEADGQFCLAFFDVTNVGKKKREFDFREVFLLDSNQAEFSYSADGTWETMQELNGYGLNPGASKNMQLVFDFSASDTPTGLLFKGYDYDKSYDEAERLIIKLR